MRSMLQALTWDYLRYAGGLIVFLWLLSFAPLIVFAELRYLGIKPGDPVMLLLELSLLPFSIFVLMTGAATGLATTRNLLTKPISNFAIASWRIGSGSTLLSIQLGLVIWCTNAIFDAGWPLQGAVLFAIAVWVIAQPFFCLGRSLSNIVLTGMPLLGMCLWYIARYKSLGSSGITHDWNELTASEAAQLLGAIAVFSLLTVRSVASDRCGDSQRPTHLYTKLRRAMSAWWNSGTVVRKPYRSPQQAYFWFEWQSKGWMMPMVLTLLMLSWIGGGWLEGNSLRGLQLGLFQLLFLLSLMGIMIGALIGGNLHSMRLTFDSGRGDQARVGSLDALSSFLATRPLSDVDMARTLLKICASNILLSLAVWLLCAAPLLVYDWSIGQPLNLQGEDNVISPLLALVITWTAMSNVMAGAVTGRTLALARLLVVALLSYATIELTLRSLSMFRLVEIVEWVVMLVLTAGTVGLTTWCYRNAYQRGDIRLSHVVIATSTAGIIAFGGMLCLPKLNIFAALGLICLGLLSVLPWASTPLAVHWNRHR